MGKGNSDHNQPRPALRLKLKSETEKLRLSRSKHLVLMGADYHLLPGLPVHEPEHRLGSPIGTGPVSSERDGFGGPLSGSVRDRIDTKFRICNCPET